ncbi:MAG: Phosphatase [Chlamydiia bacterium]|nr:Phosphatase [Chlamydiia bacterium]
MRILVVSILFSFVTFSSFCEEKVLKAILFDYQGVLSRFEEQPMFDHVAGFWGMPKDKMHEHLADYKKNLIGNFNKEDFLTYLAFKEGFTIDTAYRAMLDSYLEDHLVYDQEMLELVEDFKKRGYMVGILTNQDLPSCKIQEKKDDFRFFDQVFLACYLPYGKPDHRIYEHALMTLGIKPEECLFIDDTMRHVVSAKSLGIRSMFFSIHKESPDVIKRLVDSLE